jgi:hypothetical protein
MAEPRWKVAIDARVASARGECNRAMDRLSAARRDLESEQRLQNRDAAGRYVLLDSAANFLEEASWFLSASMGYMAAAELLALRGCAPVPTDPVASVANLRDGADADVRHPMWLALIRLQSAREYAQDTIRGAEAAYGHLWAAQFMGVGDRLPPHAGPHAVMEDQIRAAVDEIRAVLGSVVNMHGLASFAVEPAARIQSG